MIDAKSKTPFSCSHDLAHPCEPALPISPRNLRELFAFSANKPSSNKMKKAAPLKLAAALVAILAASPHGHSSPTTKEPMITQATLIRPARHITSAVAPDERILLDPIETVSLNLTFARLEEKVHLVAPNGGSINRQGGHLEIAPASSGGQVALEFAVGKARGRYTLEITQGNETRIFEFWVGPESPSGKPGPKLNFTGKR